MATSAPTQERSERQARSEKKRWSDPQLRAEKIADRTFGGSVLWLSENRAYRIS